MCGAEEGRGGRRGDAEGQRLKVRKKRVKEKEGCGNDEACKSSWLQICIDRLPMTM